MASRTADLLTRLPGITGRDAANLTSANLLRVPKATRPGKQPERPTPPRGNRMALQTTLTEERPSRYQQVLRACAEKLVSGWIRVAWGEGIELHMSDRRPKMTAAQRRQMLKRIEELVRQIGG